MHIMDLTVSATWRNEKTVPTVLTPCMQQLQTERTFASLVIC